MDAREAVSCAQNLPALVQKLTFRPSGPTALRSVAWGTLVPGSPSRAGWGRGESVLAPGPGSPGLPPCPCHLELPENHGQGCPLMLDSVKEVFSPVYFQSRRWRF